MAEQALFRASEIFDMAVRIENQGMDFYRACAGSASNSDVRKVFEYLADQESKHIEIFSGMKEGHEDYRLPESYPGEMYSYIGSFVKDRVFEERKKGIKTGAETEDPFKAVDTGLEFEKRSILFYSGIKQTVRESEKEVIEKIIAEEHRHICQLLELRRKL